jgi:hypothetical protein
VQTKVKYGEIPATHAAPVVYGNLPAPQLHSSTGPSQHQYHKLVLLHEQRPESMPGAPYHTVSRPEKAVFTSYEMMPKPKIEPQHYEQGSLIQKFNQFGESDYAQPQDAMRSAGSIH